MSDKKNLEDYLKSQTADFIDNFQRNLDLKSFNSEQDLMNTLTNKASSLVEVFRDYVHLYLNSLSSNELETFNKHPLNFLNAFDILITFEEDFKKIIDSSLIAWRHSQG